MNPIQLNIQPQELSLPAVGTNKVTNEPTKNFKETLNQFISSVDNLQKKAGQTEEAFLTGKVSDIHQVMIAVEEASVAFELLMEIRNKLLESYQQIMRMPM